VFAEVDKSEDCCLRFVQVGSCELDGRWKLAFEAVAVAAGEERVSSVC